jgi:hypothetical protein
MIMRVKMIMTIKVKINMQNIKNDWNITYIVKNNI